MKRLDAEYFMRLEKNKAKRRRALERGDSLKGVAVLEQERAKQRQIENRESAVKLDDGGNRHLHDYLDKGDAV